MDAGLPPLVRSNKPTDMKLDASGNIYLTGGTIDSVTFLDYTTIKYDPQGNQLWKARFNGSANGYDFCRAMALDSQGNVYVTGYSDAGVERHIVTIKYDSNGSELWVQSYNAPGSGGDDGPDISVDSAGNVYVAGIGFGNNFPYNYLVLKYDSSGNFLWEKRYDGSVFNRATVKLFVDRNGNVYLAGTAIQNGRDFVTIKYASLPALKGDLNLDGVMTLADVVLMLNLVFYSEIPPAAPSAGDLNCDGLLSASDVVILLQIFFLSVSAPC
ncbi:SBBP repeat-containing protein, partial [bacterium]|nr:SBBP repeat-containing protein [bacterium]